MCKQLTKKLQLKPLQFHENLSVWKRKGQNLTSHVPSRKSAFKLINFHQLLYQVKIIPNEFCSVSGKANSFFNWNSWRIPKTTDFFNWKSRWYWLISLELSSKDHIFWEGHKMDFGNRKDPLNIQNLVKIGQNSKNSGGKTHFTYLVPN